MWILHLAITSSDHNHRTIHVCSTRDHVLDVIGMTWAVYVGVMSGIRLIFDVCCRNGNTTLSLFRRFINGAIFQKLRKALFCLSFGDGCGKGCLEGIRAVFDESGIVSLCRGQHDQLYL